MELSLSPTQQVVDKILMAKVWRCYAGSSLDTAVHPNIGGALILGLGCEVNQVPALLENQGLSHSNRLKTGTIQESGGTRKTIERGIGMVKELLQEANRSERKKAKAEYLSLSLQCGGSDGYSVITANPSLGAAADLLVRHGGSAVLSETPEVYGAEHLLTSRAVRPEVAEKLLERIRWWEEYTARNGGRNEQQSFTWQQSRRADNHS